MKPEKMKQCVMVWECTKCGSKHVELLDREYFPGEEFDHEGSCNYCWGGRENVYVVMEDEDEFEGLLKEVF